MDDTCRGNAIAFASTRVSNKVIPTTSTETRVEVSLCLRLLSDCNAADMEQGRARSLRSDIHSGRMKEIAMEEETKEKTKKVLDVVWQITKKTFGIVWIVVKWFFKAIWWILKNFKIQTTSLNK